MKALTVTLVMALLLGCKQNPFPRNGMILNEKPQPPKPIFPPYVLDLPESFDFREGEMAEFPVRATVPAPATPVLTVTDLPPGAVFDPAVMKLSWQPGFEAANEPGDPKVVMKTYTVTFNLRSSADAVTSITRRALLVVRDVPRHAEIKIPAGDRVVTEGNEFVETVQVVSEDFPQGPFQLNVQNLPQSAKIEPVPNDPTQFRIRYTPDFRAVTVDNSFSSYDLYRFLDLKVTAVMPSGFSLTKDTRWKLTDARQHAAVSRPTEVVQGTDINFTLVAEDLNGEGTVVVGSSHPLVSLSNGRNDEEAEEQRSQDPYDGAPDYDRYPDTGFPSLSERFGRFFGFRPGPYPPGFRPSGTGTEEEPPSAPFGKLTLAVEKNNITGGLANPITLATVRWNQIPADKIGTSHKLRFRVCVNSNRWYKDHCSYPEVNVKFLAETHQPPTIDRAGWPLAKIQYVRKDDSFQVSLPIRDVESGGVPKVEIFPASVRDEVKWASGRLTITGKNVGIRQFNVVATSAFGVTQSESFLYEVLPWSWSSVLILGESASDPEILKIRDLFEDSALANPLLEGTLDDRTLALRTTLVVGTGLMNQRGIVPEIEKTAARIRHVVVMSPLLGNLEAALKTELEGLKVKLDKRFLDMAGLPPLKDFEVRLATGSGLTAPTNKIRLKGNLTAESPSPLGLVLESGSPCRALLGLDHSSVAAPLLSAVVCQRQTSGQGKLVLSGFEWGDLDVTVPDAKIAKKWLSEVLQ